MGLRGFMRLKNLSELSLLGEKARKQILKKLDQQNVLTTPIDGNTNDKSSSNKKKQEKKSNEPPNNKKKSKKKSRVMSTADGLSYCPWPSTDPFVKVHQALERRYGMFKNGGSLVAEMIVEGGDKAWRFDFAILPRLTKVDNTELFENGMFVGDSALLIEADGFAFHKFLPEFKNDRSKQTHALENGFLVQRITNEDVKERLDIIIESAHKILSHKRVYKSDYIVTQKGKTQSVFSWN